MKRQQGMSSISILIVVLVAIFFGNAALKVAPLYLESWTLETAITNAIKGKPGFSSASDLRGAIARNFNTNQVDIVGVKDIKIQRGKNSLWHLDASYEKRVPLMFNIDVVVKFEELIFEAPIK